MASDFQQILHRAAQGEEAAVTPRLRVLLICRDEARCRSLIDALAADAEIAWETAQDVVALDRLHSWTERLARRLTGLRLPGRWVQERDLDLGRWRTQRYLANLARLRILKKLQQQTYHALVFEEAGVAVASLDVMGQLPTLVGVEVPQSQEAAQRSRWFRWTAWPGIYWERRVFQAATLLAVSSETIREAILSGNRRLKPERLRILPLGAAWVEGIKEMVTLH